MAYATKLQIKRREVGPIDVEVHVKPELVALGVKDEIWFFADAELDPEIIRGHIEHWEWSSPDGEVHRAADITYSARMENEWQRLVCCKEMLHILDPVGTRKPDDVEALVGKIFFQQICKTPSPTVLTP